VNPDIAASRREARGEAAQLYEQNEVQRALSVFYKNLPKYLPNDRIALVDGDGDPDAVADRVYRAVEALDAT
jgi:dTMP kinase